MSAVSGCFVSFRTWPTGPSVADAKKKGMVSWLGYNTTDGDHMRSSDPPLAQAAALGATGAAAGPHGASGDWWVAGFGRDLAEHGRIERAKSMR